jgi:CRP/FNR family transcriptional regulator, cyclic AMP receptor protein
MKGIINLMDHSDGATPDPDAPRESILFADAFLGHGIDPAHVVPWEARAVEVDATRLSVEQGVREMREAWERDRFMALLDGDAIARMQGYFDFATIEADREVIRQDEYGNFMVVQLTGTMAVDRYQPWGERLRLAETKPGDILGEMSLLDSGIRFSACTTVTPCNVAVLSAGALDDMLTRDPRIAASLVGLLARKLSLRLRAVSLRLTDLNRHA